jgi:hypothetical protein
LASKTIRHIDSDDDDDEVEKDIALIIKKLWNFLKKKQGNKKFSNFKKDENKKEYSKEILRWYKCNKTNI